VIHHVVFWKLKPEALEQGRVRDLAQIRELGSAMLGVVPGLLHVEVHANAMPGNDAADLALFTRLESWAALQGYEVHPAHVQFRALVGALRTERRGFDYETA
jgi:hypothetical protein